MAFDVNKIRKDFPALNEYCYLDTASISLMPAPVRNALDDFSAKINYAGTVSFDEEAEIGSVEGAREGISKLWNCPQDNIAIINCATEGLAQVAWCLMPKGDILTLDMEHPTDTAPWFRVIKNSGGKMKFLETKNRPADVTTDEVIAAIDSNTSVVALSHAQYSNGMVLDVEAIARAAHKVGAVTVIDAVQSSGVVPIDLSNSEIDVMVAAGYKWLCGPFGAAALFINDRIRDRLEPSFVGWRSMLNPYYFEATRYDYNTGLKAWEFGTMSYAAGFAYGKALEYINNIGVERINKQAHKVSGYLMEQLDAIGATVLSPREDHRRTGTVFTRFPGFDGEKVAARLNKNNVICSPRANGTRFSCHYFNNEADVDQAIETLKRVLAEMKAE